MSDGPIGSATLEKTGPVSRPFSRRNVHAPVTGSPAAIACCTGAAPLQAGRREKWRLTQPCSGTSRSGAGTISP